MLPGERGRGIGSWLAAWTEQRATSLGSSRVGQVAPDGSLPQRLLLGRGYTLGHTSWVLELPEGREVPERPLPEGYALATGDTAERERAAYVVIQDAFDEWEGRVRDSFEDWAATTVRRPGTQPWQLRVVEHDGVVVAASFTILDSQGVGYVHQLAVERSHRGQGWPRRCSPTRSAGPASTVRHAASCRPTHAPERSTSTSRSAWRSPRCGRTW